MSLCPSSSHQLVAAAIAFRRARRKFPKDFGLESSTERVSESVKAETATSREEPINQARSSSLLVKRACSSRSDHACPASVRGRDYDNLYTENSISCSCCRNGRNGKDTSAQRDECSGGDAIDTVPSREREEVPATSAADKNEFARPAERDRCDAASRTTNDEAAATMEWISQSGRSSTFYHHREARCSSRLCSSLATASLICDATREENDRVACGDSSGDKGKDSMSSSCHGTFIDFDDGVAEDVVTGDGVRSHTSSVEDAWTKLDASTSVPQQRNTDSAWRCQHEESYPCEEPTFDLLGSSYGRHCDGCSHRRHRCGDCFHRHCCCQRHDLSMNAERCETHGYICDGRARHKSWRDPMRDESSRLYARHCHSKDSDTISVARERKNEERENEDVGDEDEEDDDEVAVINHKDSMCILAEKYKASRRCRAGRCEDQATRSADRTGKDECNKSLTSEIIDQPELLESANVAPHEESSVKHVCRAHCESCGTAIANTCNRGRRHVPSEIEYERLKTPLSDPATSSQCCSMRASCRRTF
ncbi:uncharacterized protein LOC116850819 [Odontomachus brunneus]|uniref:uncharacterized protein LOC116850819 n=1 Tax=Odontomachus brunneus TaxID=486640 RepID=UPI0013F21412|nr:uncharacterized protein LOC116850819 [Odontomachus brunneus]